MTSHPAQDLPAFGSDGLSARDWFAYLERLRTHFVAGYDALQEAEGLIKLAVRHSDDLEGPAAALGGLRVLAWKVARPIGHAGDLNLETAKALRTSEMVLRGAMPQSKTRRHRSGLIIGSK